MSYRKQAERYLSFQSIFLFNAIKQTVLGKNDVAQNQSRVASDTVLNAVMLLEKLMPIKTLIMGAAGRDFHNFNTFFRGNKDYEVVAFTATQIPDIEGRVYPTELAGSLYPSGIPIRAEEELVDLIKQHGVEQVIFAYSDVPHEYIMHKASIVNAAGADFRLMGTKYTQVKSTKPVVSVCAVRTGSGKSQTTRRVASVLQGMGYKVAAIRHPMPYGNLVAQEVQRYASYDDLDEYECTIEEREEYEPHIDSGVII